MNVLVGTADHYLGNMRRLLLSTGLSPVPAAEEEPWHVQACVADGDLDVQTASMHVTSKIQRGCKVESNKAELREMSTKPRLWKHFL